MVSPLLKQTWAMSAVLIHMFVLGMDYGFISCLLPALQRPESPIQLDLHTVSLLGSILGASNFVGYLSASGFMAVYGRRNTLLIATLPGVVGWLTVYFAVNISMLMIGRFLCGVTCSATISLGVIAIGEYTTPKYRGPLLCLKNACVCIGSTLVHTITPYCHWRTITLVAASFYCVSLVIVYTWPESPTWLASKHQYERSEKAFYWLRGRDESPEIEDIIRSQKSISTKPRLNHYEKAKIFFRKLTRKDFLKPMFIMMLSIGVMETSGRHVFPAFAPQIMSGITGETAQSYFYTLATDVIITGSALFASVLVKMLYRRTLFLGTGLMAFLVLISVCIYLFLVSKQMIVHNQQWLPVSLVVLYFFLANLGCGPVPFTLAAEVFPLAHRGVGSALTGVWTSMCIMASFYATPHLLANVGVHGFFGVSGSVMGVSLLILYFILPETKDKTLQQIENYFNHGDYLNRIDEDKDCNDKLMRSDINP